MMITEAYCIACRRMVRAYRARTPGVFRLLPHSRVSILSEDRENRLAVCPGTVTASTITHGQEDPRAAFRTARRAWGKRGQTTRREMRYADYVD